MTDAEIVAFIDKHAAQLSEHFDAVQILCSRITPEGGTGSVYRGSGNWFARQGMAREFITSDQAHEIAKQIKEAQNE